MPEESRANNVRPYRFTFSRDQRLLCPVGHLLYERRLLLLAPLLEEMASRRLDGGVPNDVRPYDFFGRAFSLGEDAIHAANTHKNEKGLPFVWQSLF